MFGLPVWLINPGGGDKSALINDGALTVKDKEVKTIPYSRYLTDDGTETGSSEMAITTGTLADPILFYVDAEPVNDVLITHISFYVSGTNALLREFGTGTALTNGCRIYYTETALGEIEIKPLLKSNYDMVRLCYGDPAFGDGSGAYKLTNAVGSDEAFQPVLNLQRMMPTQKGIKLKGGSKQRFVIAVQDDTLTGRAANFNVIVSGEEFINGDR